MTTLLAAVSAMVAALASLINLVATTVLANRRLRLQWLRDELTSEIASFLDESWHATDQARRTTRVEPDGDAAGIDSMRHHLTRLRLLGSAELVDACWTLVSLHHELQRTAVDEQGPVLNSISAARRKVLAAGKADIES